MATRIPLTTGNEILDALTDESASRLMPLMKQVELELHQCVTSGDRSRGYAYFPQSSVIHMVNELADGTGTEILMVGREGFFGTALFPACAMPAVRVTTIHAGSAFRIPESILIQEFENCGHTRALILGYMRRGYMQTATTASCNQSHRINLKLCRWLLMFMEHSGTTEIEMTQEEIAHALGVRREGISHAFGELKAAGVVGCHRGQVTIFDKGRLEARSCGCQRTFRAEPAGATSMDEIHSG